MGVEYKVTSDHFGGYQDPAKDEAVEKYTSIFWPFGRLHRAKKQLEAKQKEILEEFGIEKDREMGITVLTVEDVESGEEAETTMEDFESRIEGFYEEEFGLDTTFEYERR